MFKEVKLSQGNKSLFVNLDHIISYEVIELMDGNKVVSAKLTQHQYSIQFDYDSFTSQIHPTPSLTKEDIDKMDEYFLSNKV